MLHVDTAKLPLVAANDCEPVAAHKPTPLDYPFPKLIGAELVEATPTRVRARLHARNALCRSGSVLHGGAIMAFADMTASVGAFLNLPAGSATTTIESKTNFIGAAKEDSIIEAESVPLHVGKRSSVWQTSVRREDGKLVAVVIQTQMVI
ncbi:MAG TPA: PaaI family thioesterase [Rhizomicrobium sp.]|nr:PaaI family thioesterase [Rhizomicrobium sp.]